MICDHCGKEMIKIGELTEEEHNDFIYINEKFATGNQALGTDILKDIKFKDGEVFEYFRACYDQLAQARYLLFIFERGLKKRLGVKQNTQIFIDGVSTEVFVHPEENE